MKNEVLRHKKLAKAKKRRKDFLKKKHVNAYKPSHYENFEKDIMLAIPDPKTGKPMFNEQGQVIQIAVGKKIITKRVKNFHKGLKMTYPLGKKFHGSKMKVRSNGKQY